MLILLSPSKKLDEKIVEINGATTPDLLDKSKELIAILRDFSAVDIAKLMKLSDKLSDLNRIRYNSFSTPFNNKNASVAGFMFRGNVYDGLDFESFSPDEMQSANKHIRILSGLYGLLRPFDLIQPYRLEMGTALKNEHGNNLYSFWKGVLCDKMNNELESIPTKLVLNLASNEYYKAVEGKKINGKVVTATFKEYKNGSYKMIMPYVKKARGLMARYVVQNNISDIEGLKSFNIENYKFSPDHSNDEEIVFLRG